MDDIIYDLPWVIFEIRKQLYAISTRLVTGISQIPHIIHVANSPELFLGAVRVRGDVFPVLNTRKLLGCPSADKEAEETVRLLEENKEEQNRWLSLLKTCVEKGRRFPMPLEPNACAFGRWYNSYVRKGTEIASRLKGVEEPHNEMHALAKKIDALRGDDGSYDESAQDLLEQAEGCSQRIVSCIDGITQSLQETLTPMIISLCFPSTHDTCMAFTVDSVKAVDEIIMIDEKDNSRCLFVTGYLCGVGHNSRVNGELLLMDDLEIVKLVKIYNDNVKEQQEMQKKKAAEKKAAEKKSAEKKADEKKADSTVSP